MYSSLSADHSKTSSRARPLKAPDIPDLDLAHLRADHRAAPSGVTARLVIGLGPTTTERSSLQPLAKSQTLKVRSAEPESSSTNYCALRQTIRAAALARGGEARVSGTLASPDC